VLSCSVLASLSCSVFVSLLLDALVVPSWLLECRVILGFVLIQILSPKYKFIHIQ
jgi:hypothetical protein